MTDENLKEAETETEQVSEPKTDAKQDKSGDKKFTDSDVAAIRRKASRELTDAQAAWENEKSTFQATIDSQNETIKSMVDLLKKDVEFPDDMLELLEEKSPAEQLTFLLKRAEKSAQIPRTPQGNGKRNESLTFQHKISRI